MDIFNALFLLINKAFSIAIALFGIGFLIGFHELGHFLFCKLFGIGTPTFSIGFGPILYKKKAWGTDFTLSAIPLGGFVEIAGAAEMGQGEQKEAHSTKNDSFATKPYYQKFLVMTGGILCNMLFAYTTFILLSLTGIPQTPLVPTHTKTTIRKLQDNGTAKKAGLLEGDSIETINGVEVKDNFPKLIETVHPLADKSATVKYKRNGQSKNITFTIGHRDEAPQVGSLGISEFEMDAIPPQSLFKAISQGIKLTNAWIAQTFSGIVGMFKKADMKNVGGPIVIISALTAGATANFKIFLILLAIISINLAVINLVPLPILDGGQLLFYTIEAIIGRPLPIKVREYIHIASWFLVLGFVIYLSVFDIARIANPYVENLKQFLGFGR